MDDLISRDDVYDVLKKVNIREMPIYVFDKLWNGVRDLPSIESEERMAKVEQQGICWEDIRHYKDGMCASCGRNVYDYAKYCDECGCRLIWGEDDE